HEALRFPAFPIRQFSQTGQSPALDDHVIASLIILTFFHNEFLLICLIRLIIRRSVIRVFKE
ncbi:hypothetical protein, partial [Neptuniibacter sp.]|uniref:hypothetical protein n=1 Tax=Neptuniibacter sp. TaxID=1962643 RepID=UPI002632181F